MNIKLSITQGNFKRAVKSVHRPLQKITLRLFGDASSPFVILMGTDIAPRSVRNPQLILCRGLLDLAVRRKDRRKLKIPRRLDTALLQLHSVITSSAISGLVNFP